MGQSYELVNDRLAELEVMKVKAEEIVAQGQCFSLKDLAVNGRDLIAAGIAPGPELGQILNILLEQVLNGTVSNEREVLLKVVGRIGNCDFH